MKKLDAATLQARYVNQLRRSLAPPRQPMVNPGQTEELMLRAESDPAAPWTEPDATTWIWSDLHLGDDAARSVFGRPFRNADEADRAMMQAWNDQVADNETIICLGDLAVYGNALAHHREWWHDAPGTTWLVLGNHDVDAVNLLRPFDVDRTALALYAAGDPPLLLTHVPLVEVPYGSVNVHGHLHEQASPTDNRHVNVSVEQLDYRPARLSDVRRLARRLVEGRSVPGQTTRARLDIVERVMP